MPTKLDSIISGKKKDINFSNFDIGKVLRDISADLSDAGAKDVQGLKILGNYKNFISYEKAAKRAAEPYLQVGVTKGTLVLVLRDKNNDKFEAMDVLVKGYDGIKDKLVKETAAVISLDPDDRVIGPAGKAQADKFGTKVMTEDDYEFGALTGNIVICAHGTPDGTGSARIIASHLGKKTPKDIVKLLTGSKDAKQRIGKDYSGKIFLSGCFTASGGPEAAKQDDPFAKKVWDLLKSAGYTKASVVGMPGPSITARNDGDTDSWDKDNPTAMKRGDKHVVTNMRTVDDYKKNAKLEKTVKAAVEQFNALVGSHNTILEDLNAIAKQGEDRANELGKDPAAIKADKAYQGYKKQYLALKADLEKEKKKLAKAKQVLDKARKDMEDSGLGKTLAKIEGTFGLRTLN